MPIEPITNHRLYKKVADQIALLIQNGVYQPGQKLPGERNLIERLGVSRSSLREALISLETEGLIEIRDRSGIFVLGGGQVDNDATQNGDVLEVFAARELIEVEVAALAAQHAKQEHLETLTQLLGKMVVSSASDPKGAEHDRQFHLTLAQACGNRVLLRTVELLWENTQSVMEDQPPQIKHSESTWQAIVMEHRDIFHAIREKNPQAAQTAMQQHLENAIKRLTAPLR
ncbi:MAG: FadR/GntR family transcriptional regulator [Formivibrio sp.]|nr:FadR/GntR family transcriptional regulator [Formivibrio sp.]